MAAARALSHHADATVFTGLFHRDAIREHFRAIGVADLYDEVARRKIMPRDVEQRVLAAFEGRPLFRKTSCGVAFAHGTADYNGHYGIEGLCRICPRAQIALCASGHLRPKAQAVRDLATIAGLNPDAVTVGERAIEVEGSREQQRYFMQHALNFQVHDRAHPHLQDRHGRAEVGWL